MGWIETERLLLRRFKPFDEPSMRQVFMDPKVMQYSMGTKSVEDVGQWLSARLTEDPRDTGSRIFAVTLRSGGSAIGYCGVTDTPDIDGEELPEIGYRLRRDAWGRGYGTESAIAVRDYAFSTLGKTRLVALIDPDNLASIRVAERLGMVFLKQIMLPGYDHPDHLYGLWRG
ncbi:MAG: GNAT family N-acetyltransferase [Proteobacteria bacterium]|nr:GNAT family N-acetyltransferase [Pseudomonadota bacterium]MDA1300104.1 GNAT family N-acetyltransferase [Pseudomonadota bacterium]